MNNLENMIVEEKPAVYPSKRGQKWSEEEESLLLEELNSGLSADVIAGFHNRTLGGIQSRCGEIAYKMYLKGIPMEEIINQTKLDEYAIKQVIERKDYRNTKKSETKENKEKKEKAKEDNNVMENKDILEMKEKIIEMNKSVEYMMESKNKNVIVINDIMEMKHDIKNIKKSIEYIMDSISDLNHSVENLKN